MNIRKKGLSADQSILRSVAHGAILKMKGYRAEGSGIYGPEMTDDEKLDYLQELLVAVLNRGRAK